MEGAQDRFLIEKLQVRNDYKVRYNAEYRIYPFCRRKVRKPVLAHMPGVDL